MAQGIVNIEYEKADEYAKATTVAELSVTVSNNEADIADLQEALEEHTTEAAETYATQTALAETDANVATAQETADAAQATAEAAQATADSKAPIYHASEAETYGVGSEDLYGHLKLLDEPDDSYTISSGVAATPYALTLVEAKAEAAQETADNAVSLANAAQTSADSAMTYAQNVNTTLTSVSDKVDGVIADRDFAVTESAIDADDYTDYVRLYLTVSGTNLPSGASYPLYFWADGTDDGNGVKQTVLSDGMIYTRVGVDTDTEDDSAEEDTDTDTDTEEDEEETEETSTWEWSDWTAIALAADLIAHMTDTDNPHNVTAAQLGLTTALKYCGTVDTYDSLPTDAEQGDVYNVDDTGANYAWTGEEWDKLSETVDLSNYVTTASLTSTLADYATTEYVATSVAGMDTILAAALAGYATIDYVDEAISGIDLSGYVTSEDLASVTVEAISDDDITALFE